MPTLQADVLIGWKQIGAAIGVSDSTARRWARRRKLPAYKFGGRIRADRAKLKEWAEDQEKKGGFN